MEIFQNWQEILIMIYHIFLLCLLPLGSKGNKLMLYLESSIEYILF